MSDIVGIVLNVLGVCVLLFLACVLVICFFVRPFFGGKKHYKNEKYDERQVLARGRAYKVSLLAVVIYMFACGILSAVGIYWAEITVQFFMGILLASFIFLAVSVFGDAFFAGSKIDPMEPVGFAAVACLWAYTFARDLLDGETMIDKTGLTFNVMPLAVAVWSALIVAVFTVKRIIDKRTAENE